ncbi:MAG: DUF58 domain-containing protein [Candidatus Thermoplasmatota archaeon]|jgi:uncharacterized protein (DUF58 family)|nr:DUF58 domain-containing protein [Candidatus Thermoplasmatota archaeon]MDP7264532.1 DUF58 domain-containing protein [Candidatus Thermoplasmatota archaeon]
MWTKKAVLLLCTGVGLVLLGLIFRNLLLLGISIVLFVYLGISIFINLNMMVRPNRQMSNERIFEDGMIKTELQLIRPKSFQIIAPVIGGGVVGLVLSLPLGFWLWGFQSLGNGAGFLALSALMIGAVTGALIGYFSSKGGIVEVRDTLPKQVELRRGSNYTYLDLKPKGKTRLRYAIRCPLKGVYKLGPVSIRSHDPFYLFYNEVNINYTTRLTVFPQTREIKELRLKSRQPKMYPGEMRVKMPGPGYEFWGIRDYVPGDSFKMINWKAFASTGRLLVNEKERESVSDITIVFDAREVSAIGMESDNANIYGARAAATLTQYFLGRRDSVCLVVYSDKVMTIKKGGGQKQLYEILTALAGASPKGDIPLQGIVEVALPYLPRMSPVIIISSLDDDDSLRKAVSMMKALEFDVTILSPSTIDFELLAKEKGAVQEGSSLLGTKKTLQFDPLAYDVLRLERDILLKEMRGYGINIVDWKPQTPLQQVLLRARSASGIRGD